MDQGFNQACETFGVIVAIYYATALLRFFRRFYPRLRESIVVILSFVVLGLYLPLICGLISGAVLRS